MKTTDRKILDICHRCMSKNRIHNDLVSVFSLLILDESFTEVCYDIEQTVGTPKCCVKFCCNCKYELEMLVLSQ